MKKKNISVGRCNGGSAVYFFWLFTTFMGNIIAGAIDNEWNIR